MRPSLRPPWPTSTTLLRWHLQTPQRPPRRIATTSAANASPIDIPKLVISPGSKHHDSLPSFLEYAKRTNLSTVSPTYIGTHYEYTAALSLMRLGFSLLRIGRSNDAGVDLIGHWALPPLREPMPTIIQCKSRQSSLFPNHIRELEGSFQGIPAAWKKKDVLGLLVTTRKATRGTLDALGQSRWPMGFVLVTRDGTIQQFVWNRAAAERGLEGVGVTLRYTPAVNLPTHDADVNEGDKSKKTSRRRVANAKSSGTKKDIQLTWMGSPILTDRSQLTPETKKLMEALNSEGHGSSVKNEVNKYRWKEDNEKVVSGRPRTLHKAPSPRGGLVSRSRKAAAVEEAKEKPGIRKGVRTKRANTSTKSVTVKKRAEQAKKANRTKAEEIDAEPVVKKRGRPKGSKNKPKAVDVE